MKVCLWYEIYICPICVVSTAVIRYEAFQTQVDAQNILRNCYAVYRQCHKGLGLIFSLLYWYDRLLTSSCRPSVCNAVHCGLVYRANLCQRVPSRQVSICPFRHFCHKTHREKTSRRKRKRELFWDTENHACITYCWELEMIDIANFARHALVDWVWVRS